MNLPEESNRDQGKAMTENPQEYPSEKHLGTQQPNSGQPIPPPPGQAPYYGQPAQPMAPAEQRNWALATHLSPFLAAFVGLSFLGPLVLYLVLRDRGAFVRQHCAEALNFQLTAWIGLIVSVPLVFAVGLGLLTGGAILVAMLVCHILGAVAANEGREYRYPLTIRFVS